MVSAATNWLMEGAPFPYWILFGLWPIALVIVWAVLNMARAGRDEKEVQRSLAWPQTEGLVISSRVVWAHVEVDYGYCVGGLNYTGKFELSLAPQTPELLGAHDFNNEAKQYTTEYAPSTRLVIRYNPLNPQESVLYCRAPGSQHESDRGEPPQPFAPVSSQNSSERNSAKVLVVAACSLAIFVSLLVAGSFESQRAAKREQLNQQLEQNNRDVALEHFHNTDPKLLYDQINHESFGDQLPLDTKVIWADMTSERDCNPCGGTTDWGHGGPEIRINTPLVKTEKDLREIMQHEMCHVAVNQWGIEDERAPHGPAFQECMRRFP
jgi:hypothetical protein